MERSLGVFELAFGFTTLKLFCFFNDTLAGELFIIEGLEQDFMFEIGRSISKALIFELFSLVLVDILGLFTLLKPGDSSCFSISPRP
jgi:hypothetical protein